MRCGVVVSAGDGGTLAEAEAAGAIAATRVPPTAESTDAVAAEAPVPGVALAELGLPPVGVLGASDNLGMSPAQARAERSSSTAGVCRLDGCMEVFKCTQGSRRQSVISFYYKRVWCPGLGQSVASRTRMRRRPSIGQLARRRRPV